LDSSVGDRIHWRTDCSSFGYCSNCVGERHVGAAQEHPHAIAFGCVVGPLVFFVRSLQHKLDWAIF